MNSPCLFCMRRLFNCKVTYFLSLDHVDVNITPDKRQVMVQEEKALLLLIKARTFP